jgi:hypothetical protein
MITLSVPSKYFSDLASTTKFNSNTQILVVTLLTMILLMMMIQIQFTTTFTQTTIPLTHNSALDELLEILAKPIYISNNHDYIISNSELTAFSP